MGSQPGIPANRGAEGKIFPVEKVDAWIGSTSESESAGGGNISIRVRDDFAVGYRPRNEFKKWEKIDPVKVMRKNLLRKGMTEKTVVGMEKAIEKKVERSVARAEKAPFPPRSDLYKDIFYEKK